MRTILSLLSILILGSCVSRQDVEGNIWQMDRLPAALCSQYPFLKQYGAFRVVSCKGQESRAECQGNVPSYEEVISICTNRFSNMLAADRVQVEEWLKALGRPR